MMNKIKYWIKQLFLLDYYTSYKNSDDKNLVVTWKMRWGKCFDVKSYEVSS